MIPPSRRSNFLRSSRGVLTDYETAWQNKDACLAFRSGPLALRALAYATEGSLGYIRRISGYLPVRNVTLMGAPRLPELVSKEARLPAEPSPDAGAEIR